MTLSMDEWIETHRPDDAQGRIRAVPGLIDDLLRGRQAGLSWDSLIEWLRIKGIKVSRDTLRRMLELRDA